jgi:hypothetical protein
MLMSIVRPHNLYSTHEINHQRQNNRVTKITNMQNWAIFITFFPNALFADGSTMGQTVSQEAVSVKSKAKTDAEENSYLEMNSPRQMAKWTGLSGIWRLIPLPRRRTICLVPTRNRFCNIHRPIS